MSEPTKGGLLYASIFLKNEENERLKAQNERFLHGAIEVANDNDILEGVARGLITENAVQTDILLEVCPKLKSVTDGRGNGTSTQQQNGAAREEIFLDLAKKILKIYPDWEIDAVKPKIQKTIKKIVEQSDHKKGVKLSAAQVRDYKKLFKNGKNYGDRSIDNAIRHLFK